MAKTKEKEHKSRKKLSRTAKENWAIGIVALLILSVVVYECYTATHVRLQTYTAKETTVYRTIETTALAVREEHAVSGPGGVTVNIIAPGVIDTDMMAGFTAEDRAALAEETPVERLGTADEIARTMVFLADEASGYITGQVLGVNGGLVI